ncbi:MAG: hypothetical protein WAK48_23585 [Candidatus Acidiferrum sp.]|jgi:hypothetical protein
MTQRSLELLETALSLTEEERAELAASAPTVKNRQQPGFSP